MEVPVNNCEVENLIDPLDYLHNGVLERIFGYLNGASVIQASLVNPSWYDFTADSKECMSKISMGIHNGFDCETLQILMSSKRKYVNIYINYSYIEDIVKEMAEILSNSRFHFKVVKFSDNYFYQMSLFNYFMFLIEKNVEELYLVDFCVKTLDEKARPFDFSKLKTLQIVPFNNRSQLARIDGAFAGCKKLKYFASMQIFDSKIVHEIMKNNENLESLAVRSENLIDIFKLDVGHQFVFKLKQFRAYNFDYSKDTINENLNKFLQIQAATLEELALESFFGCDIFATVINKMKKLRNLELVTDIEANFIPNWMMEPFVPNPSIVQLSFQNKWKQFDITKAFLNGTTNLETLHLGTMDQKMMEYVNERFGGTLKNLKIGQFGALNFSDRNLFRNLKSVSIITPIIDEIKLVLCIARDRGHFENLLLGLLDIADGDEKFIQSLINDILVKSVMRCGHRCICLI
ncbi:unnamed protein product [Diamesa hyperborea]